MKDRGRKIEGDREIERVEIDRETDRQRERGSER